MSFKVESMVDGHDNWIVHNPCFVTKTEAEAYVALFVADMPGVRLCRVVESKDPPNYSYPSDEPEEDE